MKVGFTLPLPPIPTPRPRVRSKPFASAYYPKKYTEWQKEAQRLLKDIEAPEVPLEGPLAVSVIFNVEKARTSKLDIPSGDIDNYYKAILDAITKDERFWGDDVQVAATMGLKQFVPHGTSGTIEVLIDTIELSWLDKLSGSIRKTWFEVFPTIKSELDEI